MPSNNPAPFGATKLFQERIIRNTLPNNRLNSYTFRRFENIIIIFVARVLGHFADRSGIGLSNFSRVGLFFRYAICVWAREQRRCKQIPRR